MDVVLSSGNRACTVYCKSCWKCLFFVGSWGATLRGDSIVFRLHSSWVSKVFNGPMTHDVHCCTWDLAECVESVCHVDVTTVRVLIIQVHFYFQRWESPTSPLQTTQHTACYSHLHTVWSSCLYPSTEITCQRTWRGVERHRNGIVVMI